MSGSGLVNELEELALFATPREVADHQPGDLLPSLAPAGQVLCTNSQKRRQIDKAMTSGAQQVPSRSTAMWGEIQRSVSFGSPEENTSFGVTCSKILAVSILRGLL